MGFRTCYPKQGTFAYWIQLKLKKFEKIIVFLLQCLLCLVLCLCIFSQPGGFYLIFVPAMNFIALTPLKTQPSAFLKYPLLVHCNNDPSLFPELSTSLDSLPPLYFSWSLFWVYLWLKSHIPSIVSLVHFEMVIPAPALKDRVRDYSNHPLPFLL